MPRLGSRVRIPSLALFYGASGDVPKWLRERSAKPLFSGSNPLVASMADKYIVYVLRSQKDGKRYIGSTNDLQRRFAEHNQGLVKSTRNRRPLKLIYHEVLEDKKTALKRELFFKTGKGREYLQRLGY